jgi:hypothetical protein
MILGIDVGQKNLGVCVVSTAEPRVIARWAVWDSAGSWALEIHACLVQNATQEFLDGVTHVVIERQPSKNPSMTRIMHYLEFYFVSKGLKVTLQDPKHKLLYAASTEWFPTNATDAEWTYRHRKKLAVQTTASFLNATDQPLRGVFDASKKKDDLADALLHAMAFGTFGVAAASGGGPQTKALRAVNKKITARAPTDKQRRTGKLSPSNVKFLLQRESDVPSALKKDPALARALKRHFGDIDTFAEAISKR